MKQHLAKIHLSLIIPIIIGVILVISLLLSGNFAQANPHSKTTTPEDPVLASLSRQISQLEQDLLQNGIDPELRKGMVAKKNTLEKEAKVRAEYLANIDKAGAIKATALAELTVSPPSIFSNEPLATLPEGLMTEFYAPKYREAHLTSLWIEKTEKGTISYFSGNLVDDPDQGVVYVENREDGWSVEKYKTSNKDGSLKILKLEKNRLYIESKKGKKFVFDTEKKKFVDEPDNPLPITTPSPGTGYPPPG